MTKNIVPIVFTVLIASGLIIGGAYAIKSDFFSKSSPEKKNSDQNNDNREVSPAIKNQVGSYIRENIADLSPKEPVLGGSFHVTSIEFTDFHECIVNYEDGHIALAARAEFQVPSANEVEIISFELIEDSRSNQETSNNFSETGNLTSENDSNWKLVYEKPGKPALTVNLEFVDDSACFSGDNQEISCDASSWENGDRAKLVGFKEDNNLQVDILTLK